MMKFRSGLALFQRTNSRGHYNLAAFHSPHSLTWTWILSVTVSGEFHWPRFRRWKTNYGPQYSLALPFLCFQTHRQHPMWYRDLYISRWSECERLKADNSRLRRELARARDLSKLVGSPQ